MTHRAELAVRAADARGRRAARGGGVPSGIVLLEVVFALTLFFSAALVVMAGLNSALRTAQRVQLEAQAADLAVTLLSEIQMGLVPPNNDGPITYEDEDFTDWSWEVVAETYEEDTLEVALPEFLHVEVVIRHEPSGYAYHLTELMTEELLSQPPEDTGDDFGPEMDVPPMDVPPEDGGFGGGGPGGGRR